jgi:hypothetical protein
MVQRQRSLVDHDHELSEFSRKMKPVHDVFEGFGVASFVAYFTPREDGFGGFDIASGIRAMRRFTSAIMSSYGIDFASGFNTKRRCIAGGSSLHTLRTASRMRRFARLRSTASFITFVDVMNATFVSCVPDAFTRSVAIGPKTDRPLVANPMKSFFFTSRFDRGSINRSPASEGGAILTGLCSRQRACALWHVGAKAPDDRSSCSFELGNRGPWPVAAFSADTFAWAWV